MSNSGNGLKNEAIREISAASITTDWQNLGSPIAHRAFITVSFNGTNGQVYLRRVSDGDQNSKRYPVNSGRICDAKTNDAIEINGTQYQIKWVGSAPASPDGDFWFEVEYV